MFWDILPKICSSIIWHENAIRGRNLFTQEGPDVMLHNYRVVSYYIHFFKELVIYKLRIDMDTFQSQRDNTKFMLHNLMW